MSLTEIGVAIGGLSLIIFIVYYFFGPKGEGKQALQSESGQRVEIVVDGAYIPDRIKLKVGLPVEMVFDRRDKGECTEWVIFDSQMPTKEDKEIKTRLPEGEKTSLKFTPIKKGEYGFTCGMGMVKGKVIVS